MTASSHPLLQLARAPFLLLTPLCLLVGMLDASLLVGTSAEPLIASLIFVAGIAAHIAVNVLNEVEDFESGLDLHTRRTPFSGGSGCLPAQPELLATAKRLAKASLLLVVAGGTWLAIKQSGWLLLFGLVGLALIASYTRYLNRHPLACLLAPGLAFGPIMVVGSSLASSGTISGSAIWLSLPVFFAVNNLLLLNQFPDREADSRFGRHHAVIAFGYRNAALLYIGQSLMAAISGFIGVVAFNAPVFILVPGLLLPVVIYIGTRMQAFDRLPEQTRLNLLAGNVIISLLTPASLAASLWLFG